MKSKRNERMAVMAGELTASPSQLISYARYVSLFGVAKSTVSEDVAALRSLFEKHTLGRIVTVLGAGGGVLFQPSFSPQAQYQIVRDVCQRLSVSSRELPGGYIYTGDVFSQPDIVERLGIVLAGRFFRMQPDFVLTMETTGIGLAMMTARALHVPVLVARRDTKAYEGPAVKISYASTSGRVLTMALPRRAVREGQRALLVDDFMRGGGTVRGMADLMREFSAPVVGIGVAIATQPGQVMESICPLMMRNRGQQGRLEVTPASWLVPDPAGV